MSACPSQGAARHLDYGVHSTSFGDVLVAMTDLGVCRLDFVDALCGDSSSEKSVLFLQSLWPKAQLRKNPGRTQSVISSLFAGSASQQSVPVHIAGTDFQFDIWQALLQIPAGHCISYSQLALASGHPGAARAVGSAVASNPVALLIPCHRVIRQDGKPGGYRWGVHRKQTLLAAESALVLSEH
ncbi:methylated-DNA--[protein]-cysteine S-methyltransferase [Alcanivorax sp. 1008]|uniref:methylated-DNA--[protein]-cysteine S-methyltransferase n=1 Tax=Alcanivorax sp. 1008 TaxID=2816853 RepID=UPI001D7BFAD7|nr:methylated-DNA--[protein]-cysteine S-methyltransferase [Alcanivorax sp. 1008]MCC1495357.1 methylated-DNA--[protein]-cysteine S-methyltransferase [Alcanivorax sp. 1008]